MVAVRSFWLAQPGLSGSVSVNHFFAVDHVVSSEYADLVLSLRMFVAELTRRVIPEYGSPGTGVRPSADLKGSCGRSWLPYPSKSF